MNKQWLPNMDGRIRSKMDNISHRLAQRIKELADRYETPMPKLTDEVALLTSKVEDHLKKMNYKWQVSESGLAGLEDSHDLAGQKNPVNPKIQ